MSAYLAPTVVGGDVGIVLDGPQNQQAVLIYRLDSLTYLGRVSVPEPGTLALLLGGMAGFGWIRRRL
jgi:hypothetical protein